LSNLRFETAAWNSDKTTKAISVVDCIIVLNVFFFSELKSECLAVYIYTKSSISEATKASYLIHDISEVVSFLKIKTKIATRVKPLRNDSEKCKVIIMGRKERHS
jgi:hypothetical protein